ncbi:hypothetical protein CRG98_030858, partial [Punica granatum]
MDRPTPGLRLETITPPRQDIMRIWRTLRLVDHAFIQDIIGDVVMLTETPVDWIFLRTTAELWDPEHAVFNFQGTELAPTIEEYTALIQRPTPTTQGIFRPNPFTTIQVPLLNHLGSTLVFPGRVIRQLGGLQDIPVEADRLPFHIQWDDSTSTAPDKFLQIREIRRQWDASTIQRLYFPEHPTDEERAFSATSAYVARQLPPPLAPSVVPLPPATFLPAEHILSAPPPVSILAPAMIYTAPPPTVFPATTAPAPTHPQATELPPFPSLQPHVGLSYQAPPPINTTFHESGTPTNAAQFASPTYFFPEADAEQEHSLSGSALDWFMSLKAEDIPTWEDLSRKFTDQYRYCAETPPTLLELSTKEMARGQKFEEYAAKWWAQAAKHIPPISEAQQIQLFHSTLKGVYYSHLLAHTSSFSGLIEAGKKLDLGIKLERMEDPTSKGDESSKTVPTTSSSSSGRRGKEVTVNTVNTAQQAPQQYSMNYAAVPPTAPFYAPQAPQYRPQASTPPIYYSALPPPPLPAMSSPVVHHYTPAPSPAPQYQPPGPRTPQPTQRALPPQAQQGGTAQPRPRRQYQALP